MTKKYSWKGCWCLVQILEAGGREGGGGSFAAIFLAFLLSPEVSMHSHRKDEQG